MNARPNTRAECDALGYALQPPLHHHGLGSSVRPNPLRARWRRYATQLVYWERDPLIQAALEPKLLYTTEGHRREVEL